MTPGRRKRVTVVGGGVSGLSCALRLSRENDVRIVAEAFGVLSDSWKATAIWHIYLVPETEQVLSWAKRSLEVFYDLAATAPRASVELVRGVELFRKGALQIPVWSDIPRVFEPLAADEVDSFNCLEESFLDERQIALLERNPVRWGYHIEAPAASMHSYLPWLEETVRDAGTEFVSTHVSDLKELAGQSDIIVNCAGFGARELVKDTGFVPYKGQYFVLKASDSSPTTYIGDDDHPDGMAYVIPRHGEVMVGGCAEKGQEDLDLTLDWTSTVKRAGLYVPWLRNRLGVDQARPAVVGIRPCRTEGIRLEVDISICSVPVIHNYGHGGSGFSLSWGCAEAVTSLVASV